MFSRVCQGYTWVLTASQHINCKGRRCTVLALPGPGPRSHLTASTCTHRLITRPQNRPPFTPVKNVRCPCATQNFAEWVDQLDVFCSATTNTPHTRHCPHGLHSLPANQLTAPQNTNCCCFLALAPSSSTNRCGHSRRQLPAESGPASATSPPLPRQQALRSPCCASPWSPAPEHACACVCVCVCVC